MRRFSDCCISLFLVLLLVGFVPATWAQQPVDWSSRLESIQDSALRRTLENSIAAGLIADEADFQSVVARADARFHGQNPTVFASGGNIRNILEIRQAIAKAVAPIAKIDRDALDVKKVDGKRGLLFEPISGTVPPSYEATYKLAVKFDPRVGTDETTELGAEIDAYLAKLADDPVIKHALQSTGTTMADFKRNWFGSGAGFEHVICGEVKGSSVSGYHWWYKFYRDELIGSAKYVSTLAHSGNNSAYTGAFTWDPDGSGPLPKAKKKKGGFSVGNSAQAILALGHIAIESARKFGGVPGALAFDADVNGQTFSWQLYTMGGTIRSLYPMGAKGDMGGSEDAIRMFYELEDEASWGTSREGSPTIH